MYIASLRQSNESSLLKVFQVAQASVAHLDKHG